MGKQGHPVLDQGYAHNHLCGARDNPVHSPWLNRCLLARTSEDIEVLPTGFSLLASRSAPWLRVPAASLLAPSEILGGWHRLNTPGPTGCRTLCLPRVRGLTLLSFWISSDGIPQRCERMGHPSVHRDNWQAGFLCLAERVGRRSDTRRGVLAEGTCRRPRLDLRPETRRREQGWATEPAFIGVTPAFCGNGARSVVLPLRRQS
jgi:hypothetical protein